MNLAKADKTIGLTPPVQIAPLAPTAVGKGCQSTPASYIKLTKMFPTKSTMIRYGGRATLEALRHSGGNGYGNTVEAASSSIEARVNDFLSISQYGTDTLL